MLANDTSANLNLQKIHDIQNEPICTSLYVGFYKTDWRIGSNPDADGRLSPWLQDSRSE
jgi:hypothetical protein